MKLAILPCIIFSFCVTFSSGQSQNETLEEKSIDTELENSEFGDNTQNHFLAVTLDEVRSSLDDSFLQNILLKFPRVLVSFDWISENATDFVDLRRFVNVTCSIAQTQSSTNTSIFIQVWLAFSPKSGIASDVSRVVNSIQQPYCLSYSPVTKLLFYYAGPQITKVTLPLVKQDVQKAGRHLSKLKSKISLGVIFDLDALQQNEDLESLRILASHNRFMDTLLFKASEALHLRMDTIDETMLYPFEDFERYRPKIVEYVKQIPYLGLITTWPVTMLKNDSVDIIFANNDILDVQINWFAYNNIIVAIHPFVFGNESGQFESCSIFNSPQDDEENTENYVQKLRKEWLRAPTHFNAKYLGSVVTFQEVVSDVDSLMSKIFKVFKKVLMAIEYATEEKGHLLESVEKIASLKSNHVRNITHSGGVINVEDHVSIEALLSVEIMNPDVEMEKVDIAVAAAFSGNSVYPDTFTGVVLDLHGVIKRMLRNNASSLFSFGDTDWFGPFSRLLTNTTEKIMAENEQSTLHVGMAIPIQVCEFLANYNPIISQLAVAYPIIFQLDIEYQNIIDDLLNTVSKSLSLIQRCKRNFVIYEEGWEKLRVEFRVNIVECSGSGGEERNATTSYIRLGRYVHFWEEVNSFAIKTKTPVLMDKAFDYSKEGMHCGWWHVSNLVNSSESVAKYKFDDKKSVALKLYEIANPVKLSSTSVVGVATTDVTFLLSVLIPVILCVVAISVSVSILLMRYRSKYLLSREEEREFFKGESHRGSVLAPGETYGNVTAESQPYNKERYEISKDNYVIDSEKMLGSGEFGLVFRGYIKRTCQPQIPAAVKMNNTKHYTSLKGLLSEIKVLSFLEEHPNIVALLGANTADMRMGKVLVFLELCELGSLEKQLRSYNPEECTRKLTESECLREGHTSKVVEYVNVQKKSLLDDQLSRDILRWAVEVANGMEYLSSKNVVHADLATRNVLLNSDKCAKLADFGLSRRLYDYTNYVKQQQEPLPWRWMAPESLKRLEFNEKTDVWAFGVLLWELYTLGDQPYPGLAWDVSFVDSLELGLRLTEPRFNEKGMYQIMCRCWNLSPKNRPSFHELKVMLAQGNTPDFVGTADYGKGKAINNYV